jgi:CRISPR type III-A-associated RAMP protein Csm4
MPPAVLIRLRPMGPWRFGPGEGGQNRLDACYRSDRLYSALTLAARQLGWLDEWLEATARASEPAIAFSSLFPFQGDTLFAIPPATLWPPPPSHVTAPSPVFLSKIRWSAARFVPVGLIETLVSGQAILADQWIPDAESGCLLRRDRPSASPFRTTMRNSAAVDRATGGAVHIDSAACVEFEAGSGLWTIARYADSKAHSEWDARVQAAFRLLADTGFGGRRSSGWGQAAAPEFQQGAWPALLMPKLARGRNGDQAGNGEAPLHWLLSLYSPAAGDSVDWRGGDYRVTTRGGKIESAAATSERKKTVRMISEGSVLASESDLVGTAVNVAPDGFPHAVYRSGFALALKLPRMGAIAEGPVEPPGDKEAVEERPCDKPIEEVIVEEVAGPTPEPEGQHEI